MNPVNPTVATDAQATPAAFDRSSESPLAVALRRLAAEPETGARIGFNSFVGE
ncbi:hypothetical protein [Embleya sp. NBC_00896]|uniref:hypothetical protein n=1 Tax=Embleya sp. NBC_00896 TaxID=2975961 RepID=UPI00386C574F|nr:hypothetical protein OG928_31530 [Embleya sp. NBC_00896]